MDFELNVFRDDRAASVASVVMAEPDVEAQIATLAKEHHLGDHIKTTMQGTRYFNDGTIYCWPITDD